MKTNDELCAEGWMRTCSGRTVYPLNLKTSDVCIEDIAGALSKICRFGGHTSAFYSVAQHSVFVSRLVPLGLALPALLHDAGEAYLGDHIRPLKHAISYSVPQLNTNGTPWTREGRTVMALETASSVEQRLMGNLAAAFDIPWASFTAPEIKYADTLALGTEAENFIERGIASQWHLPCIGGFSLPALDSEAALKIFMARYDHLLELQAATEGTEAHKTGD